MRTLMTLAAVVATMHCSAQCRTTGAPGGGKMTTVQLQSTKGKSTVKLTSTAGVLTVDPGMPYDSVSYHVAGQGSYTQHKNVMRPNLIDEELVSALVQERVDSVRVYFERRVTTLSGDPLALKDAANCIRGNTAISATMDATPAPNEQSPGVLIAKGARMRNVGLVVTLLAAGAGALLAAGEDPGETPFIIAGAGFGLGLVLEFAGNSTQAKGGQLLQQRGY